VAPSLGRNALVKDHLPGVLPNGYEGHLRDRSELNLYPTFRQISDVLSRQSIFCPTFEIETAHDPRR
jgi:hypothetical protein